MNVVTRFIDWFLYTSLLTACCATGLCMATERFINFTSPAIITTLHILVFGSTLFVYNAPRVLRKAFARENNNQGILSNYRFWYFVFFFAGLLTSISSFFRLSWHMIIACGILGAIALSYSLPLLPFKNKKRLREYGWLKIIVLASVWTIATSVLPILYYNKHISHYPFEILLRFFFIFTLCVLFDIRDMQTDMQNNLHTLPNKMGIKNSYRLINITLLLFVGLSFIQYVRYASFERLMGAIFTAVITKFIAGYLQKHPSDRAYMGLADGVMLVYSLLVLLY